MELDIADVEGGVTAAFVKFDKIALESLKSAFPDARWRTDGKCWFIAGDDARSRLDAWKGSAIPDIEAKRQARRDEAIAKRVALDDFDAGERARMVEDARNNPPPSRYAKLSDNGQRWTVTIPYDANVTPKITEILKTLLGARFHRDDKAWHIPVVSTEAFRQVGLEVDALADRIVRTASRGLAEPRPKTSYVELVSQCPEPGEAMQMGDDIVMPVTLGAPFAAKAWVIRDKTFQENHPNAKVGDEVRYVYYRQATPEEIEQYQSARSPAMP